MTKPVLHVRVYPAPHAVAGVGLGLINHPFMLGLFNNNLILTPHIFGLSLSLLTPVTVEPRPPCKMFFMYIAPTLRFRE